MPIDYRTYQLSKSEIIRCCALCFAGMLVIAALFFDSVWPGIILSPSLYFCLPIFAKIKCEKRLKVLREEFVDFLYSLSSSVATGMHMSEAIVEARDSLLVAYKGHSLLSDELTEMIRKMSESNAGEKELLFDFAKRSGIDDLKSFVESYYICRDSGGDLVANVNRSTQVITDKLLIEKDMKTLISQKVFEGRIISALPPFIILFLRITSPDYLAPLYEMAMGRIIMLGALMAMAYAFYYSGRLSRVVFSEDIDSCLPEFMSRVGLLLGSGMVLQTVFERMASESSLSENLLQRDFRRIYESAASENVPVIVKLREYARTSGSREMIRFVGILAANLDKGTELTEKLSRESEFMWHSAKKQIEEKSKLAETKMAFPMSLMLVVLIVITIAPVMMTLK